MTSWLERMKADPVPWLLERACAPIRYRLLTEVLERPQDDPQVFQAREEANNFKPAVTISRLQEENGTWQNKLLEFEPPNPSRHRGPGMVNQYLALAEYGWDRSHPIIHCSGERLSRYLAMDASADLFELKGYAGSREAVETAIRHDLAVISAALLSRSGYSGEPEVVAMAERVLAEISEQYAPDGGTQLYDGVTEDIEGEGVYRILRPGSHPPDMFLFTLMAFHPRFMADEQSRSVLARVTDFAMQGDDIPLRVREVEGRRYMKLVDLHLASWGQEEFADGRVGFLLHDLELLARTGTLPRCQKAMDLLDWLLTFQGEDAVFHMDQQIDKVVSRSQYHYFPLEDSWRGKHKKYTDVTFRLLLILKTLDRTCPQGA